MAGKYEAGEEFSGKVTGIQPYGAFIALDGETQGLVHISEITYGFVKDINEFLTVGQEVQVKVLEVDEAAGKISLSIRALLEATGCNTKRRPSTQVIASACRRKGCRRIQFTERQTSRLDRKVWTIKERSCKRTAAKAKCLYGNGRSNRGAALKLDNWNCLSPSFFNFRNRYCKFCLLIPSAFAVFVTLLSLSFIAFCK